MDFRLSAFVSVAHNLNFTRAANELHISQPAISRHIQELETAYKTQLFDRSGSKVRLTHSGEVFLKYAEDILERYRTLRLEMNLMTGNFVGELRVGASTTIAQYVLPLILAKFITMFPDVRLTITSGNTEQVEQALEEHLIDVGLIEGSHRKRSFKYLPFAKDELVLVTNTKNNIADEVSVDELCVLPLVLRESGSGTLEVIERALTAHGKKVAQMNILLQLGSTESIKLFLENCPSVFAIVSVASVTKELLNNTLKVIEVTNLDLKRVFAFVVNQGINTDIQERFMQFLVRSL
ncbi:MAG: LysR family transcriptional regulator [Tannerellaceae bacterium]|jgi:DNA-binding transcriptional LysR family regulator|nr:LysR family transcriptional regulator [Tannerellaceae bacterium]